jgi:CRISPR system Cascade subunit CasA
MTESYSFNLIDEPWIPCVRRDGATLELSLRETLAQAHQLQMVAGNSPLETVALTRLLLVILHRVFGPEDEAAWARLWAAPRLDMEAVNAYLAEWRARFDLFAGERRFFQMDDPRKGPKSVVSLKHGVGFLHNVHFDHDNEEDGMSLTPAQAARALVSVQSFGLGGLSGITQKHTNAPCTSGVTFLINGDDLKETLLLNLPAYPQVAFFQLQTQEDIPCWEMDDPFMDERDAPLGLLDYLTWQNRRVVLYPQLDERGRIVVREWKDVPGLRLANGIMDPMKMYYRSKEGGVVPQRFTEDKGLWRDSAALFSLERTTDQQSFPPTTLFWLRSVLIELEDESGLSIDKTYRCLALGLATEKGKAGKVLFVRQENLPLLPRYLTEPKLVEQLVTALSLAKKAAGTLERAAHITGMYLQIARPEEVSWKRYGVHLSAANAIARVAADQISQWVGHTGLERRYWASLDIPFQSFVVNLPADMRAAQDAWRDALQQAAIEAFEAVAEYSTGDGRAFKALVRGHEALRFGLNRIFVEGIESQEVSSEDDEYEEDDQ